MDTDLLFGSGLSLFGHQHFRGCLHQFQRFINASYLLSNLLTSLSTQVEGYIVLMVAILKVLKLPNGV